MQLHSFVQAETCATTSESDAVPESFSRPHTVSGSSSTSLKGKFRKLPSLVVSTTVVAKVEALEDDALLRLPDAHDVSGGRLPPLVDKVVDVTVSMQQQFSSAQVVLRTVKMSQIQFIGRVVDIPVV